MTLVYLLVAVAGLPVVLLGQRADRAGRTGTGPRTAAVRGFGAAALFGGLTGFALGILHVHPAVVGFTAALVGGSAAYLRIRLIYLAGEAAHRAPRTVEGGMATVVDEVGGAMAGRIVVEAGSERWYLAARPARTGTYGPGTRVIVVALHEDTALVASPEEIGS
jgi:hypothetical protein